MGVLNMTPDSFFSDSRQPDVGAALAAAQILVAEGADLLDIGGESTRPGADPVDVREELRRVIPVLEALSSTCQIPLSVDTMKAEVAAAAVAAGAVLVNDVSGGLADPEMAGAISGLAVPVVLGHIRGTPADMQNSPHYDDPVAEIRGALAERMAAFLAAGVARDNLLVDPGIGFGKRTSDNAAILRDLAAIRDLQAPVVIGLSRKRFLGEFQIAAGLGDAGPADRLEASMAAAVLAAERGAAILRVHDVSATRRALAVVDGIRESTL